MLLTKSSPANVLEMFHISSYLSIFHGVVNNQDNFVTLGGRNDTLSPLRNTNEYLSHSMKMIKKKKKRNVSKRVFQQHKKENLMSFMYKRNKLKMKKRVHVFNI